MKKLMVILVCFSSYILFSQEKNEDPYHPHNGFQFSMFAGGMIGNIKANISSLGGKVVMRGSRMNAKFHLGYAYRNWAGGFSLGTTSMSVSSMEVNGVAYKMPYQISVDNNIFGIYLKRHFMPINMFVCLDLGAAKFSLFDDKSQLVGETSSGFNWNIAVGKEFLLGKRKRLGLGGYFNLSGIKCKDLPPYQSDNYSYVSPGMGVVFSFR